MNTKDAKNESVEMKVDDLASLERKIQLGETDELPGGRKIEEVHKFLREEQVKQNEAITKNQELIDKSFQPVESNDTLSVQTSPNGVIIARPVVEDGTKAEAEKKLKEDSPVNSVAASPVTKGSNKK